MNPFHSNAIRDDQDRRLCDKPEPKCWKWFERICFVLAVSMIAWVTANGVARDPFHSSPFTAGGCDDEIRN